MKAKLLKTIGVLLFVMVAAVFSAVAYLAYFNAKLDQSCLSNGPMPVESDSVVAAPLQDVLEQYSQKRDHVGLQAAVVFPDG